MESSSEDSFTWTNTSSDSSDSQSMTVQENVVIDKTEESNGRHRKKRKLKESFSSGNEFAEGCDAKLKVKIKKETSTDANTNNNLVKLEPDTDSELPCKKKKIKHVEVNGHSDSLNIESYDESHLDLKVKLEENSVSSSKKKRKKSSMEVDDTSVAENTSKDDISDNIDVEKISSRKSKKKKKKSRLTSDGEDHNDKLDSEEKMDIDETMNNEHKSKYDSNVKANKIRETSFTNNSIASQDESGYSEISAIQCEDDHNAHIISFSEGKSVENQNKKKSDNLYKSTIINQFKVDNSTVSRDSILLSGDRRTSRISDRIRFEDEDEADDCVNNVYEHKEEKTSLKLKKYLKKNSDMRVISQPLANNSVLSHDDEVWLVRCPKEIDIDAFCNIELNLSGKSKIKVAGQTYDGSLDDEHCNTITALSMEHKTKEIKKLPLCGIINFRKRIPKPHFPEDNVMVNNQTNFIPLPETKCRHPLFGSNYKKAIKIPAAIAERLNDLNNEEQAVSNEKKMKKKHKKVKSLLEYEDAELNNDYKMKLEPELTKQTTEKKKKQKRKHEEDEGPPPKKSKKIKHDPESAEAWESEKAIEQNLFDF